MSSSPVYGFIGLGHQGSPMAERMIAAGLRPWLWARRAEVLDRYRSSDAGIAASPTELGARCDVVGLCLYDAEATDAVLFGDGGLMSEIRPGTVVAIHATVSPEYVVELARRVDARGVRVVDAPVSGGDEVAAAGRLLVVVGGGDDDLTACRPMFDTYSDNVVRVGDVGAAQSAKLVNNSLMTAISGLVFDAFEVGRALGIDEVGLGKVLSGGSAANPSVGIYNDLGAETFSIRAWPTLHKDVSLTKQIMGARNQVDGLLLSTAETTIEMMEQLRADWVRERDAEQQSQTTEETP
jgi:3-hydroxyisobutyrate dehydrogenase